MARALHRKLPKRKGNNERNSNESGTHGHAEPPVGGVGPGFDGILIRRFCSR